jgi:hypothetical protein
MSVIKTVALINGVSDLINDTLSSCVLVSNRQVMTGYVELTLEPDVSGVFYNMNIDVHPKIVSKRFVDTNKSYKNHRGVKVNFFEKIEGYKSGSVSSHYVAQMENRVIEQMELIKLICYDKCMLAIENKDRDIQWVSDWIDFFGENSASLTEYKLNKMGL